MLIYTVAAANYLDKADVLARSVRHFEPQATLVLCLFERNIPPGIDDVISKAHPVVPGSPICGMRMPCGGRERALSGCEAIGVSTVPLGQKAAENCHRVADKQLKTLEQLENHPR